MNDDMNEPSSQEKKQSTGMVGEFYVLHALHRARASPMMTLGNTKGVDILARSCKGHTLKIEVKSVRNRSGYFLGKAKPPLDTSLYWCFVCFDGTFDTPGNVPRVWIVPSPCLRVLTGITLDKGGYGITVASLTKHGEAYRDRWSILMDKSAGQPRSASHMLTVASRGDTLDGGFYEAASLDNWVLSGYDWTKDQENGHGEDIHIAGAIEAMDADDLARTITRITRTERFVEGTLCSAGADGILMRLARRAERLCGPVPN